MSAVPGLSLLGLDEPTVRSWSIRDFETAVRNLGKGFQMA